jgi:hypothetical protein
MASRRAGRWAPTDAPTGYASHATFGGDAQWSGSDGCNGLRGHWRSGSDGALLAVGSGSNDIGCENIPVDQRLVRAARAGFDGDVLVLVDRQGAEVGRFDRPGR